MTGLATINAIIARWSDRYRALALSHALNGASVAGVVFTPLWAGLPIRRGAQSRIGAPFRIAGLVPYGR